MVKFEFTDRASKFIRSKFKSPSLRVNLDYYQTCGCGGGRSDMIPCFGLELAEKSEMESEGRNFTLFEKNDFPVYVNNYILEKLEDGQVLMIDVIRNADLVIENLDNSILKSLTIRELRSDECPNMFGY